MSQNNRREILSQLRSESVAQASDDAKAAVDMLRDEWPPGEVLVFVTIIPVSAGAGAWHSNFPNREKLVDALNDVIENSKNVDFGKKSE